MALASSSSRARFARDHHVDDHELENAVRRGLERSVDDARRAGAIGGWRAVALRFAAEHVPVEQMADLAHVLRTLAAKAGGLPNVDVPGDLGLTPTCPDSGNDCSHRLERAPGVRCGGGRCGRSVQSSRTCAQARARFAPACSLSAPQRYSYVIGHGSDPCTRLLRSSRCEPLRTPTPTRPRERSLPSR